MTININNVEYEVNEKTKYQVQVGRYDSRYENVYVFYGNHTQAWLYFQSINIGNGYKKRLLVDGKVAARQLS